MAPSDDDVVGSPGEFLDVGTVIGEGHRAAKVADVVVVHEGDALKVLGKEKKSK